MVSPAHQFNCVGITPINLSSRFKQATNHIRSGVGIAVRRKKFCDSPKVVARRHECGFRSLSGPHLRKASRGDQAVADTFSPHGFFSSSAFAHVIFNQLAGTAIADGAVHPAERPLECADVGWFSPDDLPEPLAGVQLWGERAFAVLRGEAVEPVFDLPRTQPWRDGDPHPGVT